MNRSAQPVTRVLVRIGPDLQPELHAFRLGSADKPQETDAELGLYTFGLPQPLAPGAESELVFDFTSQPRGFKNDEGMGNRVFANGTFVDSSTSLPSIGYSENFELTDDAVRRKTWAPAQGADAGLG